MQRRWLLAGAVLTLLAVAPVTAQSASGMNDTYLETRLSDLETQLRAVNGKLEQAEWQNKQLRTTLERMQGDLETRFGQLEQRASGGNAALPPTTVIAPPVSSAGTARAMPGGSAYDNDAADDDVEVNDPRAMPPDRNLTADAMPGGKPVAGQLGKLYMSQGKIKGADREGMVPTLPPKPADYGLTAREQYDRAFQLLHESNFGAAEEAFKGFISKNPQDKLVDNAKYWLGETYYARGKFDAAAVAFADAYQSAPKGGKAADSLFKLGMALAGLNKRDDACTTLIEVKGQYPRASAAFRTRVDQEVKKLKCKQ
ncbi:MAG: tol-pal system protein YbgF [Alphaproteobacteria bacterium]